MKKRLHMYVCMYLSIYLSIYLFNDRCFVDTAVWMHYINAN